MLKKVIVFLLFAGYCCALLGCSPTQKQKVDETDQWIREHMW